ncbi:tetratricopeptide repeat protein [Methylobacterium sp. HMF5984]|uniref:tetratricopeptide repeat protein n=1 Tax=Methylobacterium sp. HMF5984 TaxID=3367370 RepID=UPI0038518FEB
MDNLENKLNEAILSCDWFLAASLASAIADSSSGSGDAYLNASSYLARSGQAKRALPYAEQAVKIKPYCPLALLHLGSIYNICGFHELAIEVLLQSQRHDSSSAEVYHQLSVAAKALGSKDLASNFAMKAFQVDTNSFQRGMTAAYSIAEDGDWDKAAALLKLVASAHPTNPSVYRDLSSFLIQAGKTEEALEKITTAILLNPVNSEYYIHQYSILMDLCEYEKAEISIRQAINLDPLNASVRRHAVSVNIKLGKFESALKENAELLAASPSDNEYAECMRFLLDLRGENVENKVSRLVDAKGKAHFGISSTSNTFLNKIRIQLTVISALILRDVRTRYAESKFGFFWAIVEPMIHVGILAIVFQFTMHGHPPIGDNYFLFYYTGVMPYLLLSHIISHGGHSVKSHKNLLYISRITPFDLVISSSVVETAVTSFVFISFIVLFSIFNVDAIPFRPDIMLGSFAISWILATGGGMLSAVGSQISILFEHIFSITLRILYFTSGIFYVPSMMPPWVRDIMLWNPFLHVIDLMRTAFFPQYHPAWLDVGYAFQFSIYFIATGIAALLISNRRLRSFA